QGELPVTEHRRILQAELRGSMFVRTPFGSFHTTNKRGVLRLGRLSSLRTTNISDLLRVLRLGRSPSLRTTIHYCFARAFGPTVRPWSDSIKLLCPCNDGYTTGETQCVFCVLFCLRVRFWRSVHRLSASKPIIMRRENRN